MGLPSTADAGGDAALLAGDAQDFGTFYRRHEDAVLGFFLRRTGQPELAADLTAESFAQALASRGRYDPALGEARSWLFGIAKHVLARSIRRGCVEDAARRRLGMQPMELDDQDFERIWSTPGDDAVAALAALAPDQAAAVAGRVIDELGYDELAARLRCSESVVRQRVSRGLRILRSQLEGRA